LLTSVYPFGAAIDLIAARPAHEPVVAGAAREHVVAGVAEQHVGSRAAADRVVLGTAVDAIGAPTPVEVVSAVETADHVGTARLVIRSAVFVPLRSAAVAGTTGTNVTAATSAIILFIPCSSGGERFDVGVDPAHAVDQPGP
jgi:hypothetical protein